MNPLELRKIIQVGYHFDHPEEKPLLDARGQPVEPVKVPYTATIAFWIPAPKPFKRCDGATKVPDPRLFEVQALRDGAIFEHVQDFTFEEQPSAAEMSHRMLAVWDGLTAHSLGVEFNGVPLDSSTKPVFQFTALESCVNP